MAEGSNPCSAIAQVGTGIVFLLALITFLLQQTFYLPGPRCYVQQLYVPALDLSAPRPPENISNSTNAFLFFVLRLQNNLDIRSISYDNIALTFYYGRKAVADYVVPGFYQGRLRTAQRRDVVETRGVPWQDAVSAVSSGSMAGFRVELAARPRFKILFWYSKEKNIRITADVAVVASGMKAVEDDIMLTSAAASERRIRVFVVLFLSLFVTIYFLF